MARYRPMIAALALVFATAAVADEAKPEKPVEQPSTATTQSIHMDEPMRTGMKKPGMMKGDVHKAAARKARAMQPMMEQEEKSMPEMPAAGRAP